MPQTRVRTRVICDEDGLRHDSPDDAGRPCHGWAVEDRVEVRCTNPIHETRMVGTLAAIEAAGVSYRQLDYWLRLGFIEAVKATPGSGFPRQMPEREVAVLHLMGVLTRSGIEPATAVGMARALWDGEEVQLTDTLVVAWASPEQS